MQGKKDMEEWTKRKREREIYLVERSCRKE